MVSFLKIVFLLLVLLLLHAGVVGVGKKKLTKVLIPAHRPEGVSCDAISAADPRSRALSVIPEISVGSQGGDEIAKLAVGRPRGKRTTRFNL